MSNYGFNFRATSGYVTDPAGTTYSIGDAYPQTRNGITFGWTTAPTGVRDRSTTVDHRLAGVCFEGSNNTATFQVDLPAAGTYNIGCADGDAGFNGVGGIITIFDNTTQKYQITENASTAGQWEDINGTNFTSDTAFFAGQAFQMITFSTTTFKMTFQSGSNGFFAHLDINAVAGSFTPKFRKTLSVYGSGVGKRQSQAA